MNIFAINGAQKPLTNDSPCRVCARGKFRKARRVGIT